MADHDAATLSETDKQIMAKLARGLYAAHSDSPFSKDDWEANRAEYRKLARKLMRAMEKQGVTLAVAAG